MLNFLILIIFSHFSVGNWQVISCSGALELYSLFCFTTWYVLVQYVYSSKCLLCFFFHLSMTLTVTESLRYGQENNTNTNLKIKEGTYDPDPPFSYTFAPPPLPSTSNSPPPPLYIQLPPPPPPNIVSMVKGKWPLPIAFGTGKIYAQALCTGQRNYNEKFTADRWNEWKFAYLLQSALNSSTLYVFTNELIKEINILKGKARMGLKVQWKVPSQN